MSNSPIAVPSKSAFLSPTDFSLSASTQRARDGVTAAAHQMLSEAGAGRISAMAERAGLSVRQFRRIFLQKVGVSPKLFARIARFEAALDRMARCPGGSWTEVAQRFGYYVGSCPKCTQHNVQGSRRVRSRYQWLTTETS